MLNQPKNKILFIEDDAEIAEQVGEYLELKGFKVLYSKTATDAVIKCQNEAFTCILTDINLEKGTGDTVIYNIKTAAGNPNFSTPIIVVSSAIHKDLMAKVKDLIDWAFVKPYSMEALVTKIYEVISRKAKVHK